MASRRLQCITMSVRYNMPFRREQILIFITSTCQQPKTDEQEWRHWHTLAVRPLCLHMLYFEGTAFRRVFIHAPLQSSSLCSRERQQREFSQSSCNNKIDPVRLSGHLIPTTLVEVLASILANSSRNHPTWSIRRAVEINITNMASQGI